jgi:hypothetical protein
VATDLRLWYKVDTSVNCTTDGCNITYWNDNSTNNYDVSQADGNGNTRYRTVDGDLKFNYNPSIEFDDNTDALGNSSNSPYNAENDDSEVFVVYRYTTSGRIFNVNHINHATGKSYDNPGVKSNGTYSRDGANGGGAVSVDPGVNNTIISSVYYTNNGGGADNIYLNENGVEVGTSNMEYELGTDKFSLGSNAILGGDDKGFLGHIGEMICYQEKLTDTERSKVNTYLAVKFGITLDNTGGGVIGDYIASNGTVIWDASNNSSFHNQVIVIGRDDASGLSQKQSTTFDDSLQIYVGSLTTDNASNAGTITNDLSFITIGHNGGTQQGQGTDIPSTIVNRLGRIWKITNTNFDDDFALHIEWDSTDAFDIDDIRLLVDADGIFENSTVLGPEVGLLFTNGSVIISGISTSHIAKNSTVFITFGSASALTPLPIRLIDFTAHKNGETVDIKWSTASETNNDYFTIERSDDGINFEKVITAGGAGNSSSLISYGKVDFTPLEGVSYYRLKQTDFDGQYKYSHIVAVNYFNTNVGEASIIIFPNPSKKGNSFFILINNFKANADVTISVHNNTGNVVYTKNMTTDLAGIVTSQINMPEGFSIGIYNLIVVLGEKKLNEKLIITY